MSDYWDVAFKCLTTGMEYWNVGRLGVSERWATEVEHRNARLLEWSDGVPDSLDGALEDRTTAMEYWNFRLLGCSTGISDYWDVVLEFQTTGM